MRATPPEVLQVTPGQARRAPLPVARRCSERRTNCLLIGSLTGGSPACSPLKNVPSLARPISHK